MEKITLDEKIEMIKKHLNLLVKYKNEKQALLEIRSHISWYLKGMKNSNEVKNNIFKTKNIDDIISILENYKKEVISYE